MSVSIDPEGVETRVIHELVDFYGKSVLEVGCGDGRLTWRYAAVAGRVLALDPDEEEIARAIEDTPQALRSKVRFAVADIRQAELPEDGFDVAILSYSL
ncbi:MAG: class I SAM-dependent methyltransferase [Acidimicrobiia bacterium]